MGISFVLKQKKKEKKSSSYPNLSARQQEILSITRAPQILQIHIGKFRSFESESRLSRPGNNVSPFCEPCTWTIYERYDNESGELKSTIAGAWDRTSSPHDRDAIKRKPIRDRFSHGTENYWSPMANPSRDTTTAPISDNALLNVINLHIVFVTVNFICVAFEESPFFDTTSSFCKRRFELKSRKILKSRTDLNFSTSRSQSSLSMWMLSLR